MKKERYLLDTHSLFFWVTREGISSEFIDFLDLNAEKGRLFYSSISLWEIALLKKKNRITIDNIARWCENLISFSPASIAHPSVSDMVGSTTLPDYHRDPFDRILIAQAKGMSAAIITKDRSFKQYRVKTLWVD